MTNREAYTAGAVVYPRGDDVRAAVARGAATWDGAVVRLHRRSDGRTAILPGRIYDPNSSVGEAVARAVAPQLRAVIDAFRPAARLTRRDVMAVEGP